LHAGIPWPYPADGAATNMAESLEIMRRREQCLWAITVKGGNDELIGRVDLRPDDGVNRDMRGFWLDPELQGQGLMTDAAERVTEFAFVELGWPHLWLTNAEENWASSRIKEKQGARLIERSTKLYMSGEGARMIWFLERDVWLARRVAPRAV
jgi:RimJ/RimL family protein N-acetyltransferase